MGNRIKWLDIVKCFGMFAIYLGHFGEKAGNAYGFVFTHHVALFFLVSGCTENFNKESDIKKNIIKKIKALLVPFCFFAAISITTIAIQENLEISDIKDLVVIVMKGCVRNSFFAASLWFLTCLFVVEMLFILLKVISKNKFLILLTGLGLFLVVRNIFVPHPGLSPKWWYNIDSALYFFVFYTIGFCAFGFVEKLFKLDCMKKKTFFVISGVTAFIYSLLLFRNIDLLKIFKAFPVIYQLIYILRVLIVSWLYFVVAKLCENINCLSDAGKNSLYLCGNEYVAKTAVSAIIGLFGLTINLETPLHAYIYVILLMIIVNKYFAPVEKRIIDRIKTYIG